VNDKNELLPIPNREKWDRIDQIFYQGQNWYRIVDVIDALEVGSDPADYWSTMKRRIKSEGFNETRQEIMQFELKSPKDKRLRKHDYATRQTILRLIQSIPSPKVEECKIWLAEVGHEPPLERRGLAAIRKEIASLT
jgi:DNA-damage-inducible protein D